MKVEPIYKKIDKEEETNVNSYQIVLTIVVDFALHLVSGIGCIVAEKDMDNTAADKLSPVLPVELCSMDTWLFSQGLNKQKAHLKKKYTKENIKKISKQFCLLCIAFCKEEGLKTRIELDANNKMKSFRNSWSYLEHKFDLLREYCGGIVSIMPGTATVEQNFSLISWSKDPNSWGMTNFTPESILHCQQHVRLDKLMSLP